MENEEVAPCLCGHNEAASVMTSTTERNPARRFYCCRTREFDNCGFWVWIDPELSNYYKLAFQRIKLDNERAQERLNSQMLMESVHVEKLRMKTSECEALQRKLEKARASIKELELENKKKDWKMMVMQFAFVSAAFVVALKTLM